MKTDRTSKINKPFLYIWILVIIVCFSSYIIYPNFFKAENLSNFFKSFNQYMIFIYMFLFMIRGFTLIPGTPFVIVGALLFPSSPFTVLFISLICMTVSSIILYFFSEFLGFDKLFRDKYPEKIEEAKKKLDSPKGFLFILLWSLFPLIPTDLICYLAGTVRMKLPIFLLAVFLGELVICSFYIFGFQQIYN